MKRQVLNHENNKQNNQNNQKHNDRHRINLHTNRKKIH